ncbi:MAG: GNAT family N-acetyltransferase [Cytophagales bacterium]|nr:MAG: GNAT family N-acetyltransferase [Cytophagales bacterium]
MIRPYQPDDLQPLLTVFRQNTPVYFAVHEEAELVEYLTTLQNPQYVFVEGETVLGTAGWAVPQNESAGRIAWVFVLPDSHGNGVGRQLLDHCLRELRQQPNLKKIAVRTSQYADKFFARFGFVQVHYKPDFWAPGIHLVHMEMPI